VREREGEREREKERKRERERERGRDPCSAKVYSTTSQSERNEYQTRKNRQAANPINIKSYLQKFFTRPKCKVAFTK
jgi:hypothetical protein